MEQNEQPTVEIRELDQRQADRLTVTLYWVRGTLDTYVTVKDDKTGSLDMIGVPEGIAPHDVYYHPFAYKQQPESD